MNKDIHIMTGEELQKILRLAALHGYDAGYQVARESSLLDFKRALREVMG